VKKLNLQRHYKNLNIHSDEVQFQNLEPFKDPTRLKVHIEILVILRIQDIFLRLLIISPI
jgi:hypothetical protein